MVAQTLGTIQSENKHVFVFVLEVIEGGKKTKKHASTGGPEEGHVLECLSFIQWIGLIAGTVCDGSKAERRRDVSLAL